MNRRSNVEGSRWSSASAANHSGAAVSGQPERRRAAFKSAQTEPNLGAWGPSCGPGLPDPTPWGFVLGFVAVVATAWGAWMAWSYL